MKKFYLILILAIFALACESNKVENVENPKSELSPKTLEIFRSKNFVKADKSFSYKDYTLETKIQKVKGEEDDSPFPAEVAHAVLKKNGKQIADFQGIYHALGNQMSFGEFKFLGKDSEQVIISNVIPRGGRHWIISLEPTYKVLFDSNDFGVLGDNFKILDLNNDGLYEISLLDGEFIGFEKLPMNIVPFAEVIFKYDTAKGEYFPANPEFENYLLDNIEKDIAKIDTTDKQKQLSDLLKVMLRYIYIGKPQVAHQLFNEKYNFPDKDEMRTKISEQLFQSNVYRIIVKMEKENKM